MAMDIHLPSLNQPTTIKSNRMHDSLMGSERGFGSDRASIYGSPIVNLAFDIYIEFVVRTSHAMVDSLGSDGAEAALRQEWEHIGYAVPLNIMDNMALSEKGFIVAGYCNNWADTLFGADQKTEVTALGTRAKVHSCTFSSAAYPFCAAHLKVSVPVLCRLLAPDHEVVSRKFLTRGDDHCEILIKSSAIDPDELWRAPALASILPPPMAEEERILWSHSYFSGCWITQIKAMIEVLGPDVTLERLRPVIHQIGIEIAPRVMKELNIQGDDLMSVAKGLDALNSTFLKVGSLNAVTDLSVERRTTTCPISGEPKEVCQLFLSFYDGLVKGLNPEFEFECSQRMSEGGDRCQWILRDKRERVMKRLDDPATHDPFALLSVRYVNGEISDEEYERKMAMLKKHHPQR
jgi:hypothetical protein